MLQKAWTDLAYINCITPTFDQLQPVNISYNINAYTTVSRPSKAKENQI